MNIRNIEIVEPDNNKKGEIFARLMKDLFHSLGYDEPRLEIQKAGREIDIEANHRTENKIAIAECKAHKDKIGGSDVNKFVGSLDVEKKKIKKEYAQNGIQAEGYFISLSGFRESAIEQEKDAGNTRVILLKPQKIIKELIKGRVLIGIEKAVDSIKRVVPEGLKLMGMVDLVAFEKGWVWVLYYSDTKGQTITHFSLVHAEGKPLVNKLEEELVKKDKLSNNLFEDLEIISEPDLKEEKQRRLNEAEQKYFQYLENELGEIHFEGLPTDKETGSVRVNLENIFVPLHFRMIKPRGKGIVFEESEERKGISKILKESTKLALLANPGGGKSTLIKRIAISYAFPERRELIDDSLPDEDWFPIFIRCRELGDKVRWSITDIIKDIPNRAEISTFEEPFHEIISSVLQNGKALLLIDGLDEISEDQDRIAFVNQLRTFLATYPSVKLIVTSREAGFRIIGGVFICIL